MLWQDLETNMKPRAVWFAEKLSIDGPGFGKLLVRCPPIMAFSTDKLDAKVSV
jgi:hypothetical protein